MPRVCARCKSRHWDVPKLRGIPRGRGLGVGELVTPYRERILEAANRRGYSHLRVFGSVRRSQAGPESDIYFLVDRGPQTSLLDRAHLINDLEAILGRSVDVVPEEALHWLARPQILFEALPV
jgi:predicted nucleotidyltransferase